MRNRFMLVALVLLALGSCQGDRLPTTPAATRKAPDAAPASASVPLTRVDTTRASSICRATVRARAQARTRLDLTPTDDLARNKAVAYDALVANACK